MRNIFKCSLFLLAISLLSDNNATLIEPSIKSAKKLLASDKITLSVYNSEDYIAEDDSTTDEKEDDLVDMFEQYCLDTYDTAVDVVYSTFDTNETMMAQIDLGKKFDLVCPSDYIIQKMILKDMIVPYDDNSTPYYDNYVSPFVRERIKGIEVNGQKDIVDRYARGYMWGTLGILYNDHYGMLPLRDISSKEISDDMNSWESLWDEKYNNLLALKDSMRDMYAVGIFDTFDKDYTDEEGNERKGLQTLLDLYQRGEITEEEYNSNITEIFNRCDDQTISKVESRLRDLKKNSFGFEVDSGKIDMAQGNKFAINIAWSGDAAFAMDLSDEYNEDHEDKTILKYALPKTGANIWFDGWVMPKTISEENKIWAERFVDFISMPENAAINMDYIGYTPVIAGSDMLDLIRSMYDVRYVEDEQGEITVDESQLNDYQLVDIKDMQELSYNENGDTNPDLSDYCFVKDISYFFGDTVDDDCKFYISGDGYQRQFDTQYPDKSVLPTLAIMQDFGDQNLKIVKMWENVKNNNLPLWAYITIVAVIVVLIGIYIVFKIKNKAVRDRRKERKKQREAKLKA